MMVDSTIDGSSGMRIGELQGGGLILGYRCPSRCRHCLYGCGPHRRDGEPEELSSLDEVLDMLAERGSGARYHIGGGEPFLHPKRLEHAVAGMTRRRLCLEYVETNASWVRSTEQATSVLERLADCGLDCLLVSLSPFHAEFVPLRRTMTLIEAAERVLPRGAFVWMQHFMSELSDLPSNRAVDLETVLALRGDEYARRVAQSYCTVPSGRGGRFLYDHGLQIEWQEAASTAVCYMRLTNTSHFHVDGQKRYIPGLCAGLAIPFEQVPGEVDLDAYPLLRALVTGGPRGLVAVAERYGFVPDRHYSSACDLCVHARCFLYPRGYAELGPEGFYDPRSIPGFSGPRAHV